jgi:RNA polymerase sigma factor (sigma-70 family)
LSVFPAIGEKSRNVTKTVTPSGILHINWRMSSEPNAANITRASLLMRLKETGTVRDAAWTEFYSLYAPIVSGFARRMGSSPQDIEDLVQEVLKSFLCVTPGFEYDSQAGRFRSYLKTCVCNKMAELRRKRGPRTSSLADSQDIDLQSPAVEATWNDVWETEKLGRAVAIVRQRYSINAERRKTFQAFEMCVLLDRSTEEVALECEMSTESVRAAKSRVSKALREEFEQLDQIVD